MEYQLPEWGEFTLTGELGERLRRAVARMLELQPKVLTHERIIRGYGYGEIAGNWLETMELVRRHDGGRYADELRAMAEGMLVRQQEYGGFCVDLDPAAPRIAHWVGDQRALTGLLAAWRALGDERYLAAARRLAEHIMANWPRDMAALAIATWGVRKYCPEPYFFCTLGILTLYEATGEPRYLDFARRICLCAPRLDRGAELEHADGRMMNLQGLLGLHQATGEDALRAAVLSDHRVIADHFMWPSGGMPELLPDNLRDEACQTANWARLNLALWDRTGEERYLALAERTWLNHLYFDQHPSGGFCWGRTLRRGGAVNRGSKTPGVPFEMWYCCSETAPRALLDIGRHAVALRAGAPAIALWAAGHYRLPGCRVEIARDLAPGAVLEATWQGEHAASVSLRLPARCRARRVTVNGEEAAVTTAKGSERWLTLPSLARGHVRLEVEYQGGREVHDYPRVVELSGDANNPDTMSDSAGGVINYVGPHTALFLGPWMLKADEREEDLFEVNRRYACGAHGISESCSRALPG